MKKMLIVGWEKIKELFNVMGKILKILYKLLCYYINLKDFGSVYPEITHRKKTRVKRGYLKNLDENKFNCLKCKKKHLPYIRFFKTKSGYRYYVVFDDNVKDEEVEEAWKYCYEKCFSNKILEKGGDKR